MLDKIKYALLSQRLANLEKNFHYFKGKKGIEIGGPSAIFKPFSYLDLYTEIAGLDGVNFSSKTIWEGEIGSSKGFNYFKERSGNQFICEASDLSNIATGYYDFLISSHCLEHCANVLATLSEWKRVVKPGGALLVNVPFKKLIFDRNRPYTTFEHILEDAKNNIDEHDLTHKEEILKLHDVTLDPRSGGAEAFEKRCNSNYENRCMHHHVFNIELLKQCFEYLNMKVLFADQASFYHQMIMATT